MVAFKNLSNLLLALTGRGLLTNVTGKNASLNWKLLMNLAGLSKKDASIPTLANEQINLGESNG
jgi:hypothetical protein